MSGIKFDMSDFLKKTKELSRKIIPELAERGIATAGMQLLNDAIMEQPTVPIKEGWLRGSGSVFVQNKLCYVSPFGKPEMSAKDCAESIGPGQIVGVVGFNVPYAARLHEGIDFHFTEPSSGPKFLESKLLRNKDRYMKIIANTIKEGADHGV